jgi:hypothetical protein
MSGVLKWEFFVFTICLAPGYFSAPQDRLFAWQQRALQHFYGKFLASPDGLHTDPAATVARPGRIPSETGWNHAFGLAAPASPAKMEIINFLHGNSR